MVALLLDSGAVLRRLSYQRGLGIDGHRKVGADWNRGKARNVWTFSMAIFVDVKTRLNADDETETLELAPERLQNHIVPVRGSAATKAHALQDMTHMETVLLVDNATQARGDDDRVSQQEVLQEQNRVCIGSADVRGRKGG